MCLCFSISQLKAGRFNHIKKDVYIYQKHLSSYFTTLFFSVHLSEFQHLPELIFIHENILKHFYVLLINISIHLCIYVDSLSVSACVCVCVRFGLHTEPTILNEKSFLTVKSLDREFLKRSTTSLHFFPLSAPAIFGI